MQKKSNSIYYSIILVLNLHRYFIEVWSSVIRLRIQTKFIYLFRSSRNHDRVDSVLPDSEFSGQNRVFAPFKDGNIVLKTFMILIFFKYILKYLKTCYLQCKIYLLLLLMYIIFHSWTFQARVSVTVYMSRSVYFLSVWIKKLPKSISGVY